MATTGTYDSLVNSFYVAYYGRPADPAGLAYWSEQLEKVNGSLTSIAVAFATSDEAKVRFGSDTTAERIAQIYELLFDHAPEQAGLDYWTDVVKSGNSSLGEVAIHIMQGARGTDHDLSSARQRAAEKFTAEVANSGKTYDGYASIDTAKVLIETVKADTTDADVDAMVDATATLADVAATDPTVIDAISGDSDLGMLLKTPQGKGDPVALMLAFAEMAESAAADPAELAKIKHGGGMSQIVKSLPEGTKMHDVMQTLKQGGVDAALELIKGGKDGSTPAAGTFTLAQADGVLTISGTATSDVVVNLTTNTVTSDGKAVTLDGTADLTDAIGTAYSGKLAIAGNTAEVKAATAALDGIDAYDIVDAKDAIFAGAAGARAFKSDAIAELINGARDLTISDTLSAEERTLLDGLSTFDMGHLHATVEGQVAVATVAGDTVVGVVGVAADPAVWG
ncbi:MAG: DUF4214 domain-containing protein [Massilia sp.]